MTTKIAKWGNSLGLRLPHEIAKRYRLGDGVKVVFTETQKGVLITSVPDTKKKKLPTIQEAMANFVPEMLEQVPWGKDVGREVME